jgi:PBSX family phage terminase large subunit
MTILEGAVRSGKTFVNNILWLKHVDSFRGQGKKFILTGNTLGSVKRNVLDDISEQFGVPTGLDSRNAFELFGNTVVCFGAGQSDAYKSLKGFTAYGWYGNELTEHHPDAVRQAILRCSGKGARIFWDTNPSSPDHYVKTQYIDRSGEALTDGKVSVLSHHFALEDNPFLDEEYAASLRKTLPESSAWFKRDVLGLWVAAENAIYDRYRITKLPEGDPCDLYDEVIGGVDFGRGGQSPTRWSSSADGQRFHGIRRTLPGGLSQF